ncbi:30S ribosomal protein S2 [Candidatus Vidania fulgoroideorum]
MINYFNILLKKKKVNIGHNIKEKKRFYNKNFEYKIDKTFYIKDKIIIVYFKKLFFFLKKFFKKKKKILIVDTNKNHEYIYNSLSKKLDIYYTTKWKPGYITNFIKNTIGKKKKLFSYPDIVFIIDTNKNKVALKECIKKKIINVSITDSNYIKETDYFLPMNDDSETSIGFFIKQLIYFLNKIDLHNRLKKKKYYIFHKKYNKYIYVVKIKKESELYLDKKYFNYCINKIIFYFIKKKKKNILKKLKKVSNYYNEKIKIIGFKKIRNKNLQSYNHNNKFIIFIKNFNKPSKTFLYHIVFNLINLFTNKFFYNSINYKYSNIISYIKKKKIKFKKIYLL